MYLALGGFARPFCIQHSNFILRPKMALGGFGSEGGFEEAVSALCIPHCAFCLPLSVLQVCAGRPPGILAAIPPTYRPI